MTRRALITGGTGFVGANLARRLLADGHEVHLLVRPSHHSWRIDEIGEDLRLHVAELADVERLAATLKTIRADWIFHLAAHGAYPAQIDVGQMIATNIQGTVNLLSAALEVGFESFVNTGSSSEYGFKDHAPGEDEGVEPNSDYAVTKAAATLFCRCTADRNRVRVPTLRLYSVFGPWEEPSRLMPRLVAYGLQGRLPPLADPNAARDFVYVDDAVEAFVRAASPPSAAFGPIYNIGRGRQVALREVVEIARRVLEIPAVPQWESMPRRSWDTTIWMADSRKAKRELGWSASVDLERGFSEMVRWFRQHPEVHKRYHDAASE